MSRGKTITKGETHYIAEILNDSGEMVGFAVFDLDGNQVSNVMMNLEDAKKLFARLEEEEPPPPRSGWGYGQKPGP